MKINILLLMIILQNIAFSQGLPPLQRDTIFTTNDSKYSVGVSWSGSSFIKTRINNNIVLDTIWSNSDKMEYNREKQYWSKTSRKIKPSPVIEKIHTAAIFEDSIYLEISEDINIGDQIIWIFVLDDGGWHYKHRKSLGGPQIDSHGRKVSSNIKNIQVLHYSNTIVTYTDNKKKIFSYDPKSGYILKDYKEH